MISIIIVNYNGKKWLKGCLDSLKKQTYKNFEVIFVDNASSDGSVELVKKNYPEVKVVLNKENFGFAKGNNIGYKHSKGDYIVLLNNDTYVDKNYLECFLKVFEKHPKCGIAQSKIVLMDDQSKFDSAGSFWTKTTYLYHEGYAAQADDPKYNKSYRVFSVKGASVIIKREVVEKVGLFDEDFWSYYEETDFCHRALLAGIESWYYPVPICYHKMGFTAAKFSNELIQFHNIKNRISSFYKNFRGVNLYIYLLIFNLFSFLSSLYFLLKGDPGYIRAYFRAQKWIIYNLEKLKAKRKDVSNISIGNNNVIDSVTAKPPLKYYWYLLTGLEKYKYE